MKFTKEQEQILASTGNIKINAVAGSGKTTTIIAYAQSRPANSSILYLAFNKTVKDEAARRFTALGMHSVTVETAHSLALKHIRHMYPQYTIKKNGYRTTEIVELLGLTGRGEKHAEYVIANHINRFIAYFCNSDKQRVQQLNYLDVVTDPTAKNFVATYYSYIEEKTRLLLAKMNNGDIEMTHDFYLKKFQLSNPVLYYDYILFDEGQDASAAMVDVFLQQKATKVIVGDTHQQIYAWRYAINSLEKIDFPVYHLSTSFRFGQQVANLAATILAWKEHIGKSTVVNSTGKGQPGDVATKAVIGRTNLGLLLKAIEYVTEKKSLKRLYFEGNFNTYTYADEGTSLYDVLNLHLGKKQLIRDKLISQMNTMEELEDYVEKTEDVQLGMMMEIVETYGDRVPDILKSIKDKHVDPADRHKAEVIFSTVHKSKGMEYDAVHIVDDFITEEKLQKLTEEDIGLHHNRYNEEINLLYVAITRTCSRLYIPEKILPPVFPRSVHIQVIPNLPAAPQYKTYQPAANLQAIKSQAAKDKKYTVAGARTINKKAYEPWTAEQDGQLLRQYQDGKTMAQLATQFNRTKGAIISRLRKLGADEQAG
jgi:superfamily I DNA/RNA helicase